MTVNENGGRQVALVTAYTVPASTLYLRERWADGTADGVTFRLDRTAAGILLSSTTDEGVRLPMVVVAIEDLIGALLMVARRAGEEGSGGD